jgi:hypothetical protein
MMKEKKIQKLKKNNKYLQLIKSKNSLYNKAHEFIFDNTQNIEERKNILDLFGNTFYTNSCENKLTNIPRLDEIITNLLYDDNQIEVIYLVDHELYYEIYEILCDKYKLKNNYLHEKNILIIRYIESVCKRYISLVWNHLFKNKFIYSKIVYS